MRFSTDSVVGLLAPHICLSCGVEGAVLCENCRRNYLEPVEPRCAGCHALSEDFKICQKCRSWLPLRSVYVATDLRGAGEQLVYALKFEFKRQAAEPIALSMVDFLRYIPQPAILCPIPTASARIRQRGFDHSKLLSKIVVRCSGLPVRLLLRRRTNNRQVGAGRSARIEQMAGEFYISDPLKIQGKTVVLIDDVVTTGATLAAAAKTLKKAGASRIYAVVFAQKG